MKSVRMRLELSARAFDFIEIERCFGSTLDSIEALFIERAALLHGLLSLNSTAEQLGVELVALDVPYHYPTSTTLVERCIWSTDEQMARIRTHLRGFNNQSHAVEHLVAHVKYLRKATEDLRFLCAQGILNQRIAQAS